MNVNILGKGLIPGLRMLAPVKNVDLDQQQIARILKVKSLKVTLADSPDLITKNNLAQVFANNGSVKTPAAEKEEEKAPVEKLIEKAEEAGIETAEISESDAADLTLAEGLIDDTPVAVGIDLAQNEDAVVEETVGVDAIDVADGDDDPAEEETPVEENTSKKNKKNRRK